MNHAQAIQPQYAGPRHPFCLSLAAAVSIGPGPLGAHQGNCVPRDLLLAHLAGRFKEAPAGLGVSNSGGLVELIATADGATWTIIVTTPQGKSCLFAAGEHWRVRDQGSGIRDQKARSVPDLIPDP